MSTSYTSIPSDKLFRLIGTPNAPTLVDVRIADGEDIDRTWAGSKTRRTIPPKQIIASAALLLAIAGGNASALALTQQELVARLEAAGYAEVSDIKSTAEGTTAKAIKDGKQVRLVVDSSGQIKEQK